ncbi:MAG: Ig-like domain-containing protein, partial [bacterium]|nr:Ig-like domain-containing protein [bacterium]
MVVDEAYVYNGRLWSGELEKGQLAWPGCKTSGTFSFIHNTDNTVAFVSGTLSEESHRLSADSYDSVFVYSAQHGGSNLLMPVRSGGTSVLSVTDTDTGDTVYSGSVIVGGFGAVSSVGNLLQDLESPRLENVEGLEIVTINVPSGEVSAKGITVSPGAGGASGAGSADAEGDAEPSGEAAAINIVGAPGTTVITGGTTQQPGVVRIFKNTLRGPVLLDGPFNADADGGFSRDGIKVKAGERISISVEKGEIPTDHSFVFTFSEALSEASVGEDTIKIVNKQDESVLVKHIFLLSNNNKTLTVRPVTQYKEGERFTAKIEGVEDVSGNPFSLTSDFRTTAANTLGSIEPKYSGQTIHDSVAFGGYLLVAGDGGIDILDVSNPAEVKRLFDEGQIPRRPVDDTPDPIVR